MHFAAGASGGADPALLAALGRTISSSHPEQPPVTNSNRAPRERRAQMPVHPGPRSDCGVEPFDMGTRRSIAVLMRQGRLEIGNERNPWGDLTGHEPGNKLYKCELNNGHPGGGGKRMSVVQLTSARRSFVERELAKFGVNSQVEVASKGFNTILLKRQVVG
jgi:hypothetical protein